MGGKTDKWDRRLSMQRKKALVIMQGFSFGRFFLIAADYRRSKFP
jgi:hypothetical protein